MSFHRTRRKRQRVGGAFLVGGMAFICIAPSAHAQIFENEDVPVLERPAVGGNMDIRGANEDITISTGKGLLLARPLPASQITTTLELEHWDDGSQGAVNRGEGYRMSAVFNYTRGLNARSEVALTVPGQGYYLTPFSGDYGIGDVAAAYRHYFYDDKDPRKPTFIVSGKIFAPTGDETRGLGAGKLGFGPSVSVTKPFGKRLLAYAGAGYTFMSDDTAHPYKNIPYGWVGANALLSSRVELQMELSKFRSIIGEDYTRLLVGTRFRMTRSMSFQVNVRKDFEAAGKPISVSLGTSKAF